MSDTTASQPMQTEVESDERPSMGREIAREATINVAANAAGVVGFVAGIVVLGKIVDFAKARKARKNVAPDTVVTEVPETTES